MAAEIVIKVPSYNHLRHYSKDRRLPIRISDGREYILDGRDGSVMKICPSNEEAISTTVYLYPKEQKNEPTEYFFLNESLILERDNLIDIFGKQTVQVFDLVRMKTSVK